MHASSGTPLNVAFREVCLSSWIELVVAIMLVLVDGDSMSVWKRTLAFARAAAMGYGQVTLLVIEKEIEPQVCSVTNPSVLPWRTCIEHRMVVPKWGRFWVW